MAGSHYERVLGAEWVAMMTIQTADALAGSGSGFALPNPARYFATMIVFLSLAGVAMFGEKPGRLAAAFGGVALLAFSLAPTKKGGKPVILRAIDYFTALLNAPPNTQQGGLYLGPAVLGQGGINQYGGTATASNPEGPPAPILGAAPGGSGIYITPGTPGYA